MLFNDYRSSFPEIGQSGHENDHAPPFSAEVKNEWSQNSPPLHALMECAGTSVLVKNESATFLWQMVTPFIMRWFPGRTCKNKCYINPSEILGKFYIICVIEKNEMGGACGAYGGGERCAQGSGGET